MIRRQFLMFLLRVAVSSFGMWVCITWFGESEQPLTFRAYLIAGLVLALINSLIKPLVTLIALPLAILTIGLSTLLINIGMVVLAIHLLPGVSMSLLGAALSALTLAIINVVANILLPGLK